MRFGALELPNTERELAALERVPGEALSGVAGLLCEHGGALQQPFCLLGVAPEIGEEREPRVRRRPRRPGEQPRVCGLRFPVPTQREVRVAEGRERLCPVRVADDRLRRGEHSLEVVRGKENARQRCSGRYIARVDSQRAPKDGLRAHVLTHVARLTRLARVRLAEECEIEVRPWPLGRTLRPEGDLGRRVGDVRNGRDCRHIDVGRRAPRGDDVRHAVHADDEANGHDSEK